MERRGLKKSGKFIVMIILHFHLPPQFTYELHVFYMYTSRHFTPHGRYELNKLTSLLINVWLHSSVGRASLRYCEDHGFESHWSPVFFRLLLSNCLNWKIYCNDHSSLSSTTAVHIWIISYILNIISLLTGDMNSANWPRSLCVASI